MGYSILVLVLYSTVHGVSYFVKLSGGLYSLYKLKIFHFRFPRVKKNEISNQSRVKMKHFGMEFKENDQPELLKPKTVTLVDAVSDF